MPVIHVVYCYVKLVFGIVTIIEVEVRCVISLLYNDQQAEDML